jgi:hypothetical protein
MWWGYQKIRPALTVCRHGIAESDGSANKFRYVSVSQEAPLIPGGYPFFQFDGGTN